MVRVGELVMIMELHRQGLSLTAIGRQLGLDRKTVRTGQLLPMKVELVEQFCQPDWRPASVRFHSCPRLPSPRRATFG